MQPAGRASPPPRPTESRRLPTAERRTRSFARRTCAALPDADCGRNCESPHDVHGFRGSGARRRGKRPPPKSNCNTSGMERKSARVYAAEPPRPRSGLRRASGRVFSSASLRAAQREGAGLYCRAYAPFCLLCAATASPRFPARQRSKPIAPGQPFTNASGGPPSLSRFASPAALAGSGTRRPRAP